MKAWMLPWLLPVGMLGAVVFVAVFGRYAGLAAAAVGAVLVLVLCRVHTPAGEDADIHYWRLRRR
jgi:hypothetical protein